MSSFTAAIVECIAVISGNLHHEKDCPTPPVNKITKCLNHHEEYASQRLLNIPITQFSVQKIACLTLNQARVFLTDLKYIHAHMKASPETFYLQYEIAQEALAALQTYAQEQKLPANTSVLHIGIHLENHLNFTPIQDEVENTFSDPSGFVVQEPHPEAIRQGINVVVNVLSQLVRSGMIECRTSEGIDRVKTLQEFLIRLASHFSTLTIMKDATEKELKDTTAKLAATKKEADKLYADIQDWQSKCREQENNIRYLEDEKEKLTDKLHEYEQFNLSLRAELAVKEQGIQAYVQNKQEELKKKDGEVAAHLLTIRTLREQNANQVKTIESFTAEYSEHQKIITAHKKEQEGREKKIAQHEATILAYNSKHDEIVEANRRLIQERDKLKEDLDKLKTVVSSITA